MQIERLPQQTPQEIHIVKLVPEQAIPAMQSVLIDLLQKLPTPITITQHEDLEWQSTEVQGGEVTVV